MLLIPFYFLLTVVLLFTGIIYREKLRFKRYGVDLPFQQAVNVFIRGGFRKDIAEAAKRSKNLKQSVPVEKLQLHAASGGNPLQVIEALEYLEKTTIESLRAGFRHVCLVDLSGKPLPEVIQEAEELRSVETSGSFDFSGMSFSYIYKAKFRRPIMSVAFDSFSEEPVIKEINRKIRDLSRYHKELLRIKAGDTEELRRLILHNVLRKAHWEQHFKLVLIEHDVVISVNPDG